MTYLNYVIAAYLVFVVVLLWDFVAPRIRVAQLLRAVRMRIAREKSWNKSRPNAISEPLQ